MIELSQDEMNYIKQKIADRSNHPHSVFIEFIMHTGARSGEALKTTKECLDKTNTAVFVVANKGSNNRLIKLPPNFFARLSALAENKKQGEKLFNYSYSMVKKIWRNYSPESCRGESKRYSKGLHSLRHMKAKAAFELGGKDIRFTQKVLGHKNINSTLVYVDRIISLESQDAIIYKDVV